MQNQGVPLGSASQGGQKEQFFWGKKGPFFDCLTFLGSFWPFWAILGYFGHFWAILAIFGLFWAILGHFGLNRLFGGVSNNIYPIKNFIEYLGQNRVNYRDLSGLLVIFVKTNTVGQIL